MDPGRMEVWAGTEARGLGGGGSYGQRQDLKEWAGPEAFAHRTVVKLA